MRTNDRLGRAEPATHALYELAQQQLVPRTREAIVITQGFIGSEAKAAPLRLAALAVTILQLCLVKR